MKHVSILVPAGSSVLSSIIGSYKIFNAVNEYYQNVLGKEKVYEIDFVGITEETKIYNDVFTIRPTKLVTEVEKTDLIVISTIVGDMPVELKRNEAFVPWIMEQRSLHDTEVASLCLSAFLLAATGLLNGKEASTHWLGAQDFRKLYPAVDLKTEKVITDNDGIYTSGGAYSFLNLLLYIVDKHCGKEVAVWCSKLFEIEFNRLTQSQFTLFRGQKMHQNTSILQVQEYIEANTNQKILVSELAQMANLSERSFIRHFKKATGNTPTEYIQRTKIEVAKKSLELTNKSINQIMYDVGYSDPKSFRILFKKITGFTPVMYKSKYNLQESEMLMV